MLKIGYSQQRVYYSAIDFVMLFHKYQTFLQFCQSHPLCSS